jgi:hypothetical protein
MPISVVYTSLKGTVTVIPPTGAGDIDMLSVGKALSGMLDGPAGSGRPRVVGSDIFILSSVKIVRGVLIALTSYPIRLGKYNELKNKELSLQEWMKFYKEKMGHDWPLNEKDLKKLNKEKKSRYKLSEFGYNSVLEDNMQIVLGGNYEELAVDLLALGASQEEVDQLIAELKEAVEKA